MKWKRSNPEMTPEQLAAWADGELDRPDAERIEAWLTSRPEATSEAEASARLVQLYRDHPPPEPSEHAWQTTLGGVQARLAAPASAASRTPGSPWRLRLLLGLAATAAAVLGGVLLARTLWPEPPVLPTRNELVKQSPVVVPDEPEEPFPVVTVGEVNIISIDVEDADRMVMVGQQPMGTFELAAPEDIEIVKLEPGVGDGRMPRLRRGPEVPMIVVASAGNPEQ